MKIEHKNSFTIEMVEQRKTGLKRLVNFHRLTGNTYMTWNFGQKQNIKIKAILIVANICLFLSCIYFTWFYLAEYFTAVSVKFDQIRNYHDKNSKFRLLKILHIISITGYISSTIICFILNLIEGREIVKCLYDQDIEIDATTEKRIVTKILILQFGFIIIDNLSYALIMFFQNGPDHNSYCKLFVNYIIFMLNKNIHLILLSLLAYQCYVIEEKFHEMTLNFKNLIQFKKLSAQVFKITNLVKQCNTHFNFYLLVTVTYYFVSSINNFTTLYHDRKLTILIDIPWVIEIFLMMFFLCFVSGKIENGYQNFLNKYELLHERHMNINNVDVNYSLINRLYCMKEDLCFTAFDLFKINSKTFMSLVSLIITFTVILIQTEL